MKMTILAARRAQMLIDGIIVVAANLLASSAYSEQVSDDERRAQSRERRAQARRIEGLWVQSVAETIDCQTGEPVPPGFQPPVKIRTMFMRGGTMMEVLERLTPTRQSPGVGTWYFDRNQRYKAVWWWSNFNADTGAFVSKGRATQHIKLSTDGSSWSADNLLEAFDADNNPVGNALCTRSIAVRLE
jgi:hypothetical protein